MRRLLLVVAVPLAVALPSIATWWLSQDVTKAGPYAVERVIDGDTLVLATGEVIRLADIDAPEDDQPFGEASRARLEELIGGTSVEVRRHGTDRYDRTLATVWAGSELCNKRCDVGYQLVRQGLAWRWVDSSVAVLWSAERKARLGKRGLWSAAERPIAPWEWRSRAQ